MDTEDTKVVSLLQEIVVKLGELSDAWGNGHASASEPTAPAEPLPELLTAEQAWNLCALSKSAWYKARSSGKIPAPVRIGGALRWRRDEMRDWLREGCPPVCRWNWTEGKKMRKNGFSS
jgi:predicted DNA-binding transcriptional regulator AlpA